MKTETETESRKITIDEASDLIDNSSAVIVEEHDGLLVYANSWDHDHEDERWLTIGDPEDDHGLDFDATADPEIFKGCLKLTTEGGERVTLTLLQVMKL